MDSLQAFLREQQEHGILYLTPQEGVEAFRQRERELEKLKELLKPAQEQSARGEFVDFDFDEIKKHMFAKLAVQNGVQ